MPNIRICNSWSILMAITLDIRLVKEINDRDFLPTRPNRLRLVGTKITARLSEKQTHDS